MDENKNMKVLQYRKNNIYWLIFNISKIKIKASSLCKFCNKMYKYCIKIKICTSK